MKDKIASNMIGIDNLKEIFDLWYEVTYLRMILSEVLSNEVTQGRVTRPSQEQITKCRENAQKAVNERFGIDLEYKVNVE